MDDADLIIGDVKPGALIVYLGPIFDVRVGIVLSIDTRHGCFVLWSSIDMLEDHVNVNNVRMVVDRCHS